MNRKLKSISIVKSILTKDDLYVIILPEMNTKYDTLVFLTKMNCTEIESTSSSSLTNMPNKIDCDIEEYSVFSGLELGYDQFVVNSFMFISGEPLFVVSVDNFGLLVIDIVSKKVVDSV